MRPADVAARRELDSEPPASLARGRVVASALDAVAGGLARAQVLAGVRIAPLATLDDQRAAAGLWQDIWDRDGEPPVPSDLLRALGHAGNYLAGAWDGGTLVGALIGFYAGTGRADHLHSHVLGVVDGARSRGVGFALKVHQRLWSLEHGLDRITWTYDPLVRGNGFFNVAKLAAEGVDYIPAFYGSMSDTINGGDESDRVLVEWRLLEPRAVAAAQGIVEEVDVAALRAAGAAVALDTDAADRPLVSPVAGDTVLCQVPRDILRLRREDPGRAREWRHALRAAFLEATGRGLRLRHVSRDGWYVLSRPDAVA